jgi:uncharacterized protein
MVEPCFLLDVNVLVALFWPRHEQHDQVRGWFGTTASRHWATCPITQAGFVRVASNLAMTPDAPSPAETLKLLQANLQHPGHIFWPDDLEVPASLSLVGTQLQGSRQITDAYLLGLAIHRKGRFATLDRSVASLMRDGNKSGRVVELSRTLVRSN